MPISVDWPTKVINVPKDYTTLVQLVPFEIRELDIDNFRLDLRELEAEFQGMGWERTHNHNTTVTVGGVTLARVIEVVNNYTITFEDGTYAVNLVGANSNIADVTNLNNVQVRSANSAGLTFSQQINNQAFVGNKVYIDVDDGESGNRFPKGTPTDPTNNLADAIIIGLNFNFNSFDLTGQLSIPLIQDINKQLWCSSSVIKGDLTLNNSSTLSTKFRSLTVSGQQNGRSDFEGCYLPSGLTGLEGFYDGCGLKGTFTFAANPMESVDLYDCFSLVTDTTTPIFDLAGSQTDVNLRGYTGGIELQNITNSNIVVVDVKSGIVLIDPTCTQGTIIIRGDCTVKNASDSTEMESGTYFGNLTLINESTAYGVADRVWEYTRP